MISKSLKFFLLIDLIPFIISHPSPYYDYINEGGLEGNGQISSFFDKIELPSFNPESSESYPVSITPTIENENDSNNSSLDTCFIFKMSGGIIIGTSFVDKDTFREEFTNVKQKSWIFSNCTNKETGTETLLPLTNAINEDSNKNGIMELRRNMAKLFEIGVPVNERFIMAEILFNAKSSIYTLQFTKALNFFPSDQIPIRDLTGAKFSHQAEIENPSLCLLKHDLQSSKVGSSIAISFNNLRFQLFQKSNIDSISKILKIQFGPVFVDVCRSNDAAEITESEESTPSENDDTNSPDPETGSSSPLPNASARTSHSFGLLTLGILYSLVVCGK